METAMTPMPTKPMIAGGDNPPERNASCRGEESDEGVGDGVGESVGGPTSKEVGRGLSSSTGYSVEKREREEEEEDMAEASGQVAEGQLT
jgi:hypothetical protein